MTETMTKDPAVLAEERKAARLKRREGSTRTKALKPALRHFAAQFVTPRSGRCEKPGTCGSDGLCPPCAYTKGDNYRIEWVHNGQWRMDEAPSWMPLTRARKEALWMVATSVKAARVVGRDGLQVFETHRTSY